MRSALARHVFESLWRVRLYSSRSKNSVFRGTASVVPFSLTEAEAKEKFNAWHRAAWLAPSNLTASENLMIRSAYFPFWCFETELSFSYSATPSYPPESKEHQKATICRGTLPNERFSFDCPQMQVYASFKHRRDFSEAVKIQTIPNMCCKIYTHHHCFHGTLVDAPKMRQGMAWELALRNIRKLKQNQIEQHLKSTTGASDIEGLHLNIQVSSRKARLYFFPSYLLDYTFSRSYTSGGELQEIKFQTMIGGTPSGQILGERHYCPQKTRLAASVLGGSLGASVGAITDTSFSICAAETMFWTFMAATFSGLYAKYSAIIDRWHQMHRLDWEHQQYAKSYFKEFREGSGQVFSDYQDCLKCENEWRHWEEIQKWNWKEEERHKWGETLWREQHQRRRDIIKLKHQMERERIRRAQEEQREERRWRRFGKSEHFHHHGVEDFAWRLNAGGNRDAFGYYAVLSLDPTGTWTEKEIKEAFQKQALLWHPDLHAVKLKTTTTNTNGERRNLEQMRAKFQSLQEAYEVLRDPRKKELYDQGRLQRHEI